jgi:hypothetical protein
MDDDTKREPVYAFHLNELLPLHEAAGRLLSPSHLRTLVRTGRVQGVKLGRNWFTTRAAVDAYLAQERKTGPKPTRKRSEPSGSQ